MSSGHRRSSSEPATGVHAAQVSSGPEASLPDLELTRIDERCERTAAAHERRGSGWRRNRALPRPEALHRDTPRQTDRGDRRRMTFVPGVDQSVASGSRKPRELACGDAGLRRAGGGAFRPSALARSRSPPAAQVSARRAWCSPPSRIWSRGRSRRASSYSRTAFCGFIRPQQRASLADVAQGHGAGGVASVSAAAEPSASSCSQDAVSFASAWPCAARSARGSGRLCRR
jgi:hypothetical protein